MPLYSYFQDSSSLWYDFCAAFALHHGTSVFLPFIPTDSAAGHTGRQGVTTANYHPNKKVRTAAVKLAIFFSHKLLTVCLSSAACKPPRHVSFNTCFHTSGFGEYLKTVLFNVALSCAIWLVSMTTSQLTWAAGLRFCALTVWTQFSYVQDNHKSYLSLPQERWELFWGESRDV